MKKFFLITIALLVTCLCGCTPKKVLYVYSWCDYFSPNVIAAFEKKYNCRVAIDIFDSNEMMFAKLQTGGARYDIIVPTHYFINKLKAENLIIKLNKDRIANLKYLDNKLLEGLDPGLQDYAVPYFLSYTGLGYNKQKVTDFQPSWNMFKRGDLKGNMTLLDDYVEVIGAAMLTLGYKNADMQDKTKCRKCMDEICKLVLEWRKNVIKFENEQYKNGLSAGEFFLVMGYSMDLGQIASEDPKRLSFVMPKEGCLMGCDMLVIPAKASSPDLAYEFINFVHDPEQAAKNITDILACCPNTGAYPLLSNEVKSNPSLCIPEEIIQCSEFIIELTPEQEKLYLETWNKIKIGEKP